MLKKRRLILPLLILIAICIVIIYLSKPLKYTHVYNGIVATNYKDEYIFEQDFSNNVKIFNDTEEWRSFAHKYLLDSDVKKLNYKRGPIIVIYTNISLEKSYDFFDAKMIKRNLFSYSVTLQKRGTASNLTGFDKNFNYKNISIYQLSPQLGVSKLITKVKVN